MSYTYLVEFRGNQSGTGHEFQNSWGGAARVWDALFEAYVPKKHEHDVWLQAASDGRLWKLGDDPRLSDAERTVYRLCCDNALVKRENFQAMAAALREFAAKHPVGQKVCHLEGWAKVFDSSDADAIGLYATSVGDNPWSEWDEESEDYVPYDLTKGDKHWFVFDRQD